MSSIQAIYISDVNDNLIYEYIVSLNSPSFKSLLTNIESFKQNSISVINLKNITVYFKSTKNLVFYILCPSNSSSNSNPLDPFVFINRLIEVMVNYFGNPLSSTKIEANYDILTLIINEMIDNGTPHITDFNKLRDLVPMKNLLSNIFSNSVNSNSNSNLMDSTKGEISNIPWRRSNVKYTNNELFVDITETINVILMPKSTRTSTKEYDSAFYSSSSSTSTNLVPIIARIDGDVQFTSHLSGIPDLQLILNTNHLKIGIPSFHPCIRIDKWLSNPGSLSFIPPDGNFQLMSYSIDLNDILNSKNIDNYLGFVNVDFKKNLGTRQNEFEVKLYTKISKQTSKIENLKIEFHCNENITNLKTLRSTHGDLTYKGDGKAEWVLRNVSAGISPMLRGIIITNDTDTDYDDSNGFGDEKKAPALADNDKKNQIKYIKLSYNSKGSLPSGFKVDSLKILSARGLGENVKPYKGVKYITKTGDFIVR